MLGPVGLGEALEEEDVDEEMVVTVDDEIVVTVEMDDVELDTEDVEDADDELEELEDGLASPGIESGPGVYFNRS